MTYPTKKIVTDVFTQKNHTIFLYFGMKSIPVLIPKWREMSLPQGRMLDI